MAVCRRRVSELTRCRRQTLLSRAHSGLEDDSGFEVMTAKANATIDSKLPRIFDVFSSEMAPLRLVALARKLLVNSGLICGEHAQ